MTFEELLRLTKTVKDWKGEEVAVSPDFIISVQGADEDGVRIIVHAHGEDSDTLDYKVHNNELIPI